MTRMRIAITGSSGLLGQGLQSELRGAGHTVHRMVRDRAQVTGDAIFWDPDGGIVDTSALEGVDAVVHLAGEPFGAQRWNAEVKRRIRDSRVHGTQLLAQALASMAAPPRTLVCASGAGYYGDRGDEVLTEEAGPGDDFLAGVCVDWEQAADPARDAGIRVVHARTGAVIAKHSLLIDKVRIPFSLGVGGRVGSGRQYVPWISYEDEVGAFRFALEHDGLDGPVNFVSPDPVTNAELTRAIGDVLRRPTILPIPMFALRIVYGEVATTLASASQRVVPQRLQEAGYAFRQTDLRGALRKALKG